jgi:hypothetical protein
MFSYRSRALEYAQFEGLYATYALDKVVDTSDDPFAPHTFDVPISSRVLGTSWNLNHNYKRLCGS